MTDEDVRSADQHHFRLRVIPWWTDDCSSFLNNIFKWLPTLLSRPLITLEFGGGNSTLYLLSKGCRVVTVESDDRYIRFIEDSAKNIGYNTQVIAADEFDIKRLQDNHLVIVKAQQYSEVEQLAAAHDWDFIVNDGIARHQILSEIHTRNINSIIILDNIEYCANWGRLDRTSAKPDLIAVYRGMLRDKNWRHYIFEQPEGREGRGSADKSGWESPHRWASAVLWPDSHLLAQLMVTHIGLPLVNATGLDNADVATLSERCPFDWTEMKWKKASFPDELDLKLPRSFD